MAAGTIVSVSIDSIPYDVAGDADFSKVVSMYENKVIPTSGDGLITQEKRVAEVSGVTLIIKGAQDVSNLKGTAESGLVVPLSFTQRDGVSYQATGTIELENITTKENRASVKLLPIGEWTELT